MLRFPAFLPAPWAICILLCLVACGCTSAPGPVVTRSSFVFADWDGPALTVYAAEPAGLAADAPVVIVMHGVGRNADEYRDNWVDLAGEYGLRIYAPAFDRARFPGAENYNLGGIGTGSRAIGAYSAIEPLFAYLRAERGVARHGYILFGHSAGAQFVHRFTCFADAPNLELAVAANSGWYTMPSETDAWPYGLGGLGEEACDLKGWFARPMLIALGNRDTDPDDPNLRRTPEAMAQGPYRFARGLAFLEMAKTRAEAENWPIAWTFEIVDGVAHDNRGMAIAIAELITKDKTETMAAEDNQE